MLNEIINELYSRGVSFTKAVDITILTEKENRGYSAAIVIGIALSPSYIYRLSKENILDYSEFGEKEHLADELGEWTADFINSKGYEAFAQSESNLLANDCFDAPIKTTPLPHKKVATHAGLGWIGKNNLLVTPEYGSGLVMSTVLTNAPIPTENSPIILPKCGECTVCKDICPTGAIRGTTWNTNVHRDKIVDVYNCRCCLKCLSNCSWTQKYMNSNTLSKASNS